MLYSNDNGKKIKKFSYILGIAPQKGGTSGLWAGPEGGGPGSQPHSVEGVLPGKCGSGAIPEQAV